MATRNSTNETWWYNTTPSPNYVCGGAFILVAAFGVSGNFLVIYSILKQRSLLKNNYYYLVLHLAICDLMTILGYTHFIHSSFFPNADSRFLCITLSEIAELFYTTGLNLMALIAVVRFRAVVYPLKPALGRWKLRVFVTLVYAYALVSSIPFMLVRKFNKTNGCSMDWPNKTFQAIYQSFLSAVQYFIPVTILSVLYSKICIALIKQNEKIASLSPMTIPDTAQDVASRRNIRRVKHHRNIRTFVNCAAVVVSFAVSGLPINLWFMILNTTNLLRYNVDLNGWLLTVQFLGTCSVNPLIYGVFDKSLMSAFKRRLTKIAEVFGLCKKPRQNEFCYSFPLNEMNTCSQN